jgi:hypothetical protein
MIQIAQTLTDHAGVLGPGRVGAARAAAHELDNLATWHRISTPGQLVALVAAYVQCARWQREIEAKAILVNPDKPKGGNVA